MKHLALALVPALFLAASAPPAAAQAPMTATPVTGVLDTAWHLDSRHPLADLLGPATLERGGRGGGRRRGDGGRGGDGGDGEGRRRGGDGGDGKGDRPSREEILQKYDANGNGKLDPEEMEAMRRDRRARREGDGEGDGERRRRRRGGGDGRRGGGGGGE